MSTDSACPTSASAPRCPTTGARATAAPTNGAAPAAACPHHHAPASAAAAPASPQPGLAARLRAETQDLHDRAETHPFQRALAAGAVSRAKYAEFLAQLVPVYESVDAAVVATAVELRGLAHGYQPRAALVRLDLADLRSPLPPAAPYAITSAALTFAGWLRGPAGVDAASVAGVLYVLEGATNGNKVIAKAIRRELALEGGRGTRSLDPYGEDQRPHWVAFRSALDTLPQAAAESEAFTIAAVAAARRTFELFISLSDEMA